MTKLVLIDDEALVRAGFRMILDAQPDMTVVGEASDGDEAVSLVRREQPDVVLMDIRMRRMNGVDATRAVVAEPEPPRVIVLTTFDHDEYVFEALRAGASGFLLKEVSPEELTAAVRLVAAGEAVLQPSVTRRVIAAFAGSSLSAPARPDKGVESLTARELEVYRLVAQALSNAEIAAELHISETTAKTHVARILTKLGLRDRVQAVVRAYESGLASPGS